MLATTTSVNPCTSPPSPQPVSPVAVSPVSDDGLQIHTHARIRATIIASETALPSRPRVFCAHTALTGTNPTYFSPENNLPPPSRPQRTRDVLVHPSTLHPLYLLPYPNGLHGLDDDIVDFVKEVFQLPPSSKLTAARQALYERGISLIISRHSLGSSRAPKTTGKGVVGETTDASGGSAAVSMGATTNSVRARASEMEMVEGSKRSLLREAARYFEEEATRLIKA